MFLFIWLKEVQTQFSGEQFLRVMFWKFEV